MSLQQQAPPAADICSTKPPPDWSLPLGIVGTLVGAALGILAFWGLYRGGLYAIMLPGVLAGLGGGYALKRRSFAIGLFAAVVSLPAMVLTEWWFRPFRKDESLNFFLAHVHHLPTAALLMMLLGAIAAFWFGMGRDGKS